MFYRYNPYRRNADRDTRGYERSGYGNVESRSRYLVSLLREGRITHGQLELLSYANDPAARLVAPISFPPVESDPRALDALDGVAGIGLRPGFRPDQNSLISAMDLFDYTWGLYKLSMEMQFHTIAIFARHLLLTSVERGGPEAGSNYSEANMVLYFAGQAEMNSVIDATINFSEALLQGDLTGIDLSDDILTDVSLPVTEARVYAVFQEIGFEWARGRELNIELIIGDVFITLTALTSFVSALSRLGISDPFNDLSHDELISSIETHSFHTIFHYQRAVMSMYPSMTSQEANSYIIDFMNQTIRNYVSGNL